eukprot:gene9345-biopygen4639
MGERRGLTAAPRLRGDHPRRGAAQVLEPALRVVRAALPYGVGLVVRAARAICVGEHLYLQALGRRAVVDVDRIVARHPADAIADVELVHDDCAGSQVAPRSGARVLPHKRRERRLRRRGRGGGRRGRRTIGDEAEGVAAVADLRAAAQAATPFAVARIADPSPAPAAAWVGALGGGAARC